MTAVDIKVRGYHLDIYQHVNNARYLEFFEEARWDYFESHPFFAELGARNLAFVVANININYRRPAFAGETIRIHTQMDSIGNKSAKIKQQCVLLKDGEDADLIADVLVTFCLMDEATQKATVIEGNVRELLQQSIETEALA